jgi:methyl-accepting chemotaxis protein
MEAGFLGSFSKVLSRSVAARLAGGYVLLIAMMGIVAFVGITNIGKIRATYDEVLDVRVPRLNELQQIQAQLSSMSVAARDALLTSDSAQLEKAIATIEAGRTTVGTQLEALQKAMDEEGTVKSKELAQEVGNNTSAILIGLVKFSRFTKAGKRDMAIGVLHESLQPQFEQLSQHIAQYQALQIAGLKAVKKDVAAQETSVGLQAAALAMTAIVIAALFAIWVVRSVVVPLREATVIAGYMAQGDFSHRMVPTRDDEVGNVIGAFNEISEGLTRLVESIRSGSDQVNEVAQNITARNVRIEDRAAEQTKALSVAMEFIQGVQSVIADNVATASEAMIMANNMSTMAQRSSVSVGDAVDEMARIKQSSQKITDIISLIDGIAFQTNILALNAAVEAARAGEQGRGFAVVAAEVRSLAGRSAQASKEIKGLINSSQVQVENGTQKVQSITRVIDEVTQAANQLKVLVENISSGSEVQSKHMVEMVESVNHLEAGNDNNLHIVGGMRMSLNDLREMAHSLNAKVAEFKTINGA